MGIAGSGSASPERFVAQAHLFIAGAAIVTASGFGLASVERTGIGTYELTLSRTVSPDEIVLLVTFQSPAFTWEGGLIGNPGDKINLDFLDAASAAADPSEIYALVLGSVNSGISIL